MRSRDSATAATGSSFWPGGKLDQEDLLADFQAGELFTKYLVGEIRVDFLDSDDDDDIATSDRQRLKQTDPRYRIARVGRAERAEGGRQQLARLA